MLKHTNAFPAENEKLLSTTLGWRMVNPLWTRSGQFPSEKLQKSSPTDTASAMTSKTPSLCAATKRQLQHAANGTFCNQVVQVPGVVFTRDEDIRLSTNVESFRGLRPAFRVDASITAGNSNPLSDEASALLIKTADDVHWRV